MATKANATFAGKDWNEQPFSEIESGTKLTHVSVTNV